MHHREGRTELADGEALVIATVVDRHAHHGDAAGCVAPGEVVERWKGASARLRQAWPRSPPRRAPGGVQGRSVDPARWARRARGMAVPAWPRTEEEQSWEGALHRWPPAVNTRLAPWGRFNNGRPGGSRALRVTGLEGGCVTMGLRCWYARCTGWFWWGWWAAGRLPSRRRMRHSPRSRSTPSPTCSRPTCSRPTSR